MSSTHILHQNHLQLTQVCCAEAMTHCFSHQIGSLKLHAHLCQSQKASGFSKTAGSAINALFHAVDGRNLGVWLFYAQ